MLRAGYSCDGSLEADGADYSGQVVGPADRMSDDDGTATETVLGHEPLPEKTFEAPWASAWVSGCISQ